MQFRIVTGKSADGLILDRPFDQPLQSIVNFIVISGKYAKSVTSFYTSKIRLYGCMLSFGHCTSSFRERAMTADFVILDDRYIGNPSLHVVKKYKRYRLVRGDSKV